MEDKDWNAFIQKFGAVDTILAGQILALNLTQKYKITDRKTGFTKRILKKSKKIHWRLSDERFNHIVKIWRCFYDYGLEQSIPSGMGGHVPRSLDEIFDAVQKED